MTNLILIGFMGTGKTSIGKVLSRELGYEFLDTDSLIETAQGRTITQIFEQSGETYFRGLESEIAQELSRADGKIIATGGGFVINQANIAALRQNGVVISLVAEPEVIYERVRQQSHRPLLAGPEPLVAIRRMLRERSALYQNADMIIDVSTGNPEELAATIIAELKRRGIVNG